MASPYRCRKCDHRELVLRLATSRADEVEMEPPTAEPIQDQLTSDQSAPVRHNADTEQPPALEAAVAPEASPIPVAAEPPAESSEPNVHQTHNQVSHSAVT